MKRLFSIQEAGIFVTLLVLVVTFQLINPVFLSAGNVAGILRAMAYTGIMAVGLSICLIAGTIDISVGAIAGLSSVVFSEAMVHGFPIPMAVAVSVVIGALAGYVNSLIIVRLRVSPFITTISTMYVFRGLASYISSGYSIYPLPAEVNKFGSMQPLGVSWSFLIMVAVMVLVQVLLDRSVWGLCLRATGSDYQSAADNEVNVKAIQTSALVIVGALAAVAGVLVTTILGAGQPTAGTGWEIVAIAGCAIGGVSLFGYEGSIWGLFLGLLTIQVINNGIITVGISIYTQNIFIGIILLVSMVMDVRRRKFMNIEQF